MKEKIFYSIIFTFIATIPALIFYGAKIFLSPEGFLQNFLVLGAGVYFLGTIQFLLIIFWGLILFILWSS